jgi:hypothetical protein
MYQMTCKQAREHGPLTHGCVGCQDFGCKWNPNPVPMSGGGARSGGGILQPPSPNGQGDGNRRKSDGLK